MDNNFRSGFVAIIGRPNVGKSTLMNHLIGQKIAITSNKPQTTRNKIQTVYTCDEGQIVFLDTPGIHKAKNKLGEYMVQVAERTLKEVDAIMWLVEPSTFVGAGERHIAEQLQKVGVPVILIINKIDTVKKEELLPAIDTYRKICDFAEIIPCSALRGKNTQDIIPSIFKYLPYGPMFYDEDTVTDQPQRQIAAEIIREKALHALDEEIPHGIAVAIDRMKKRPGRSNIIDIDATIICERNSHKGIIIGSIGALIMGSALFWMTPFRAWQAPLMSLLIIVSGTLGALVMSSVKRSLGAVRLDTSMMLTRGALDRMEMLFFSAPVFYHSTIFLFMTK
mgnify:CR=1 FL=1